VKRDLGMGDYACAEFGVPSSPMERQWERCETMNGAWGYDQNYESSYYSSATMIQQLVTCVSRDGNYLLNIGPKGDGTVTAGSVSILQGFAAWMPVYEDSIRGCTRSPFSTEPSFGRYTAKSGKLFAHVFSWPGSGHLIVPRVTNTITDVYLMSDQETSLSYTLTATSIDITVPGTAPDASDSVVCIEMDGGMPVAAAIPAVPIDLINPGFELPDSGGKLIGFDSSPDVPGWSDVGTSADSGVENSFYGVGSGAYAAWFKNTDDGAYQMTGYTIHTNDLFLVGFSAANAWDSDQLTVTLFTGSAASPAEILGTYTATLGASGSWAPYSAEISATAGSVGQELGIMFHDPSTLAAQNWSAVDDVTLSVISGLPSDTTPPAAPTGLVATAGDGSVSLAWTDNSEGDLASYTVYRSTTSGSNYVAVASGLTVNTNADNTATNGAVYYYVVSAVDTNSNESAFSSEVSAEPSAIAPEEYIIAGSTISGGTNLSLSVSSTVPNHIYYLLHSDTLMPPLWATNSYEAGNGSNLMFNIPVDPLLTNCFFKVDVDRQ